MLILEMAVLVCLGSLLAGLLGSLTGLGGGAIIVPMLVLGFGVDIRYAMGASLVSVIATSSGAAAAYVRDGFSNIRIGMFLEIATAAGAVVGASLVHRLPTNYIAMVFGTVLIISAFLSLNPPHEAALAEEPDRMAVLLQPGFQLPDAHRAESVLRPQCAGRIRIHVWRRPSFRLAGHRLGRLQGPVHGPHHAPSVQGFGDNQQLHDRRDGRCGRRHLSARRLCGAGPGHAGDCGHAASARWPALTSC